GLLLPLQTQFFIKEKRLRSFSVLPVSQFSNRYSVAGGAEPLPYNDIRKFLQKRKTICINKNTYRLAN
ncbi:MAG: hypothetical protein IJW27_02040, partial [Clostridia bacterium]|nr:hypothetical protein [Clostridia bacterium]